MGHWCELDIEDTICGCKSAEHPRDCKKPCCKPHFPMTGKVQTHEPPKKSVVEQARELLRTAYELLGSVDKK